MIVQLGSNDEWSSTFVGLSRSAFGVRITDVDVCGFQHFMAGGFLSIHGRSVKRLMTAYFRLQDCKGYHFSGNWEQLVMSNCMLVYKAAFSAFYNFFVKVA